MSLSLVVDLYKAFPIFCTFSVPVMAAASQFKQCLLEASFPFFSFLSSYGHS